MLVQVQVRQHLRPAFPGDEATEIVHDYRVDAEYVAGDPGNSECPPTDEGFDIGEIYAADGVTPVALTDDQVEEIEQIMLANVHNEREYEREEARAARND
jgi:hypothetical protein